MNGKEELYQQLRQKDPEQAATLDPTKTQRLIRSLEIIEITGMSVTELQARGKKLHGDLRLLTAGLSMPRASTNALTGAPKRCLNRGSSRSYQLFHKYQPLLESGKTAALQSVGYQELFQHLEGTIDFDTAVTLIKQHTRNYAKRQMTFFNNRLTVNWLEAPENRQRSFSRAG